MKRRNFIKLTSTASAIGLFPAQIANALNISKNYINCDINNRKIVLIYLFIICQFFSSATIFKFLSGFTAIGIKTAFKSGKSLNESE